MVERKGLTNNSLQLSLKDIIQKILQKDTSFLELYSGDQREVLNYIQSQNLNMRVFGHKWYDILTRKFYAIEYLPKENTLFEVNKEKREFSSFADFFSYIQGDIYQNTCFYGYNLL